MSDLIKIEGADLSKLDQITNVIKLRDIFPEFKSLGARETGLLVRQIIEKKIDNNVITLDFEGIESVTQGFADELIGVLIRKRGADFVISRIRIVNVAPFIRSVLNFVASYSSVK